MQHFPSLSAAFDFDSLGHIVKVDRTGRGFIYLKYQDWKCTTEGFKPIENEEQVCEDCLHAQDDSASQSRGQLRV